MRQFGLALTMLAIGVILQGCGIGKTTFGGLLPSEGDYSSSGGSGSTPVTRKAFLWTEDATSSHYANGLQWGVFGGDWVDANGTPQGTVPFASVPLLDDDTEKVIDIDVTAYAIQFGADFRFNHQGGTSYEFYSREWHDAAKRPELIVERGVAVTSYDASADTTINLSTLTPRGAFPTLNTADGVLLRFDAPMDASVTKVTVRLHATTLQYGDQVLELYRP